jgi:hypothetical protein
MRSPDDRVTSQPLRSQDKVRRVVQVNGASLLADEAGDFTFASGTNINRYFIVCTIMMHNCKIGDDLLALRRELAWNRAPLRDYFHVSSDAQVIRDSVCDLIKNYSFTIQANVMQKSKSSLKLESPITNSISTAGFISISCGTATSLSPNLL